MKRLFSIILCLAITGGSLLVSCKSPPKTLVIEKTIPARYLADKTVFLGIGMTEWKKANVPLLGAAIYNNELKETAKIYNELQEERIALLYEEIEDFYKSLYNTEIVYVVYPFKKLFNPEYFKNPNKSTLRSITNICTEHEAEYVLTFIGQMKTTEVADFGKNGSTVLVFEMVLFDKSGKTITKGRIRTDLTKIRASDVNKFITLFDEANNSLKSLISAMGG